MVSVLVSVGFSICFAEVRGTAQTLPHGRAVNISDFAVLDFRAECCEIGKMDFKSPAYAIPPPGQFRQSSVLNEQLQPAEGTDGAGI